MEGMTGQFIAAILLGYLAVFVFGITTLVAFGLLVARYTKAARILFAAGLFCASVIMDGAILWLCAAEFDRGTHEPLIVVFALSLFLAATGQFVAAFRNGRTYAAAFGCAAVSMMLAASPILGGDWAGRILGGLAVRLAEFAPCLVVASLLPALASLVIAIFLPLGFGPQNKSKKIVDNGAWPG